MKRNFNFRTLFPRGGDETEKGERGEFPKYAVPGGKALRWRPPTQSANVKSQRKISACRDWKEINH